jgi:hypothetical protein
LLLRANNLFAEANQADFPGRAALGRGKMLRVGNRQHFKRCVTFNLNAAPDGLLEGLGRLGLRKVHNCLYGRQHIPGSVFGLTSKNNDW